MTAKLVLNRRGVRALLRSPGMQANMVERAQRIAAAAGDGYGTSGRVGRNRARATAGTVTAEGVVTESREHRLARAIDAGR